MDLSRMYYPFTTVDEIMKVGLTWKWPIKIKLYALPLDFLLFLSWPTTIFPNFSAVLHIGIFFNIIYDTDF